MRVPQLQVQQGTLAEPSFIEGRLTLELAIFFVSPLCGPILSFDYGAHAQLIKGETLSEKESVLRPGNHNIMNLESGK